jgi:hypothetical protein
MFGGTYHTFSCSLGLLKEELHASGPALQGILVSVDIHN